MIRESAGTPEEFRARQLRARDMLRGDLEGQELEQYVQERVITTKLDHVEKRLDELILEARSLRTEYKEIERRLSYLEGRANGRSGP